MNDITRNLLGTLAVLLGLSGPVFAGALEDAGAAYSNGDYATTLRLLRPLADQGNGEAQYDIGILYENGQGAPQNSATAAQWYRKAADQGYAAAQLKVSKMYEDGVGVGQDSATALLWLRRSAEQGNALAQAILGMRYLGGKDDLVPQDDLLAYMWLLLAKEQGLDGADDALELAYEVMSGAQIKEAEKMAHEWKENHKK